MCRGWEATCDHLDLHWEWNGLGTPSWTKVTRYFLTSIHLLKPAFRTVGACDLSEALRSTKPAAWRVTTGSGSEPVWGEGAERGRGAAAASSIPTGCPDAGLGCMVGEGIGLSPKGQIPLLAQVRGDGGAKGAITHSISNVPKGAQILPQTLSTFPGRYVLRHQHIYVPCV